MDGKHEKYASSKFLLVMLLYSLPNCLVANCLLLLLNLLSWRRRRQQLLVATAADNLKRLSTTNQQPAASSWHTKAANAAAAARRKHPKTTSSCSSRSSSYSHSNRTSSTIKHERTRLRLVRSVCEASSATIEPAAATRNGAPRNPAGIHVLDLVRRTCAQTPVKTHAVQSKGEEDRGSGVRLKGRHEVV